MYFNLFPPSLSYIFLIICLILSMYEISMTKIHILKYVNFGTNMVQSIKKFDQLLSFAILYNFSFVFCFQGLFKFS